MPQATPTILTFYAKPFLRGPLAINPCKGDPPTIEYLKPPTNETYNAEILITCGNTTTKTEIDIDIKADRKTLQITVKPPNKQSPTPTYTYTRKTPQDPPTTLNN